MKRNLLVLIILSAFVLFSCQKEINDLPSTPGTVDSVDTVAPVVLLKKYIKIDQSLTAPFDTVLVAEYHYDALNRPDVIHYRYHDESNPTYFSTEKRFYNGNDTLLKYRIVDGYEEGIPEIYHSEEHFFYDGMGKMVKDSVIGDNSSNPFVYQYQFLPGYVHSLLKRSSAAADTMIFSRHKISRPGPELSMTSHRDTGYQYSAGIPNGVISLAKGDYTYDTHPNPLFRLAPKWPDMFEFEHVFQEEPEMEQPNNYLTSFKEFTGWSDPEELTFTYLYLSNGYPASATVSDIGAGITYKVYYTYY